MPSPSPKASTADALIGWLEQRASAMEELLIQLVSLETPSQEPPRLEPVYDLLGQRFSRLDMRQSRSAGAFVATSSPARAPWQMLVGHADTVWPVGTLQTFPVERRGELLRGPGVYDMKAGLVQMIYALEALHALELSPALPLVVVINGDEEIGSPRSARLLLQLARRATRAFVLEPSLGSTGKLKTARKGGGRFRVKIQGIPAHAGLSPEQGASAILELSYVIQDLFQLNDLSRGVTVNVGVVDGGLRPNVVAPHSSADVDVRVPTHEEAERVEQKLRSLRARIPGVNLTVEGSWGRPPMEPTPRNLALFEQARELGMLLGLDLEGGAAGGSSDGSTLSQVTAVLDGLGAVGDGAHSLEEHCLPAQMPVRSALLALLLLSEP